MQHACNSEVHVRCSHTVWPLLLASTVNVLCFDEARGEAAARVAYDQQEAVSVALSRPVCPTKSFRHSNHRTVEHAQVMCLEQLSTFWG